LVATGSLKVVLQNRPPAWLDWAESFAVGQTKVQNPPKRLHLTFFDKQNMPLSRANLRIVRVRKLSNGAPGGKAMSFELMFDTFESIAAGRPPERA
jgi:hypothetical protein